MSAPTLDAPVWIKTHGGWQCGICNETPDFTKWSECEPLLNQIERDGWEWDWDNYDGRYTFEVQKNCEAGPNENSLVFYAHANTRTAALCRAVARAYGWKGEEVG